MALGDWLSGLFSGGGGGASVDPSNFAPAMSPGQIGTGGFTAPTADDPSTSISQTGNAGSGSGVNAASIAKALNSISAGLKQAGGGDSSGAAQPKAAPVGQAASGTGQGSASGMNALVQMLMANQNKYFPGGPNTQPVAQGRSAGLLGF